MTTNTNDHGAPGHGLGRKAATGAAVTVAGQGGRILIQVLSVVILARLLSPKDYGLFAMVMSVAGLAEVFRDFGLSQAVVQAKTFSRAQRDLLFWLNALIGLGLSLLIYLASWAIAAFYHQPELTAIAQGACGVFFLNGLATQYRASLNRELRFTAVAVVDLVSTLLGFACAILLGLYGFGVWALVFQLLVQGLVLLVGGVAFGRWLPRLPRRSTPVRAFLRFGWHMVATQIVTYIGGNADRVIIGLFLGAAPLGIYTRPYQLVMNIANQLRAPITNVAIPVLSRLQDAEKRYWEFTRIGQTALGYTIVAALGLCAGAAVPMTDLLLGTRWEESAPVLSLLSAAAGLQTLGFFGYWVYVSKGITAVLFKYNLLSVIIKLACLLVGVRWGVTGVAAGYLVATFISWPLSLAWIGRSIDSVPIRMFTFNFIRMATLATLAAGASYAVTRWSTDAASSMQILMAMGCTAVVYILGLAVPSVRRDIFDLLVAAGRLRKK